MTLQMILCYLFILMPTLGNKSFEEITFLHWLSNFPHLVNCPCVMDEANNMILYCVILKS